MKFIEEESRISDDLPWVNEYIVSIGQANDISPVELLKVLPKGIMVICQDFKGFLFKNSKTYEHILEAMTVWKDYPSPGYAIYGQALQSGKLAIGIEDSEEGIFTVSKKGEVIQKLGKDTTQSHPINSNPFIRANIPVPTTEESPGRTRGGTGGRKNHA